jgi:hypothetical protein
MVGEEVAGGGEKETGSQARRIECALILKGDSPWKVTMSE